jgi:kinetochore protein Spc24
LAEARNSAKKAATRPETVPSAAKHQAMVQKLDSERLALVKSINQAETELANKESELKKLHDEVAELEATDEADLHPVDGTA